MAEFLVRPLTDDDLDQYFAVRAQAFGLGASRQSEWLERIRGAPDAPIFGASSGPELLGALRVIPGGQWVCGRSVPMGGVAGVVVRPEARGLGVARALAFAGLEWMRGEGIAVSSLHPASTRVYRSYGWELAGRAGRAQIPTRSLAAIRGDAGGPVERLGAEDLGAVRQCHVAHGAIHGGVDRSAAFWSLLDHAGRRDGTYTYGVRSDQGLAGYVAYTQSADPSRWGYQLRVDDIVAADRATAVSLWRFLGAHTMQVQTVTVPLAYLDALRWLIDEHDDGNIADNGWMHRIVDLPAAIEARGYPGGFRGAVRVRVRDPWPGGVSGTWRLSVEAGRGEASAAETAELELDVGALSALYIGGANVHALGHAGRISGPPEAVTELGDLLAAPPPTLTDDF